LFSIRDMFIDSLLSSHFSISIRDLIGFIFSLSDLFDFFSPSIRFDLLSLSKSFSASGVRILKPQRPSRLMYITTPLFALAEDLVHLDEHAQDVVEFEVEIVSTVLLTGQAVDHVHVSLPRPLLSGFCRCRTLLLSSVLW
ncbi:hypothetical protein PENTCL1PPCAC_1400, partial [Pristionchus entomophagus]